MKTLIASFPTSSSAREAAAHLQRIGLEEVQVDRISRFAEGNPSMLDQGPPRTLTGVPDRDRRVLAAEDPSFGGTATFEAAGGRAFVLTVLAPPERADEAAGVISQHGGTV